MTTYANVQVGQFFSIPGANDEGDLYRKGHQYDESLTDGQLTTPPAGSTLVELSEYSPIVHDRPTEIERAAVTLLLQSRPNNPLLGLWIQALAADPDERRDIETLVFESPDGREYVRQGWVGPKTEYDRDNRAFGAILDHQPRGHYERGEDRYWAIQDSVIARLAWAVVYYRQAGRPDGDQTHTIQGMGGPLLSVATSLAAAVAEYHEGTVEVFHLRLEKAENND